MYNWNVWSSNSKKKIDEEVAALVSVEEKKTPKWARISNYTKEKLFLD